MPVTWMEPSLDKPGRHPWPERPPGSKGTPQAGGSPWALSRPASSGSRPPASSQIPPGPTPPAAAREDPPPGPGHRPPAEPSEGARARALAARAIQAVLGRGRSLTEALEPGQAPHQERDRPLVQELSYGVLRQLPRLRAIAAQLLHKPLKPEDGDLEALIHIGLYQLLMTRIPPHAAVASTVAAARVLGKDWAASLVNALLRRFQRERETLLNRIGRDEEVRWLFPPWLRDWLQGDWPDHWRDIIEASNAHPPLWLRVNGLVSSRDAYRDRLAAAGLASHPVPHAPAALRLDTPLPMSRLPGYAEGMVSVQDVNAQLAAPLLEARPGDRVLDACAAPGGKTAHLQELAGGRLDLTALDLDPQRLASLSANLQRLSLKARVQVGDASQAQGDWAQEPYDRILLDAPCSATGVIRRHPDIKWLRRPEDIPALCARQSRMLDALWPLLAPGGTLVYVTCSLLPDENEHQIRAFLSRHRDAVEVPILADWGLARLSGRQLLPRMDGGDGFYFARLRKATH